MTYFFNLSDEMKEVAHATEEKHDAIAHELSGTQERLKSCELEVSTRRGACARYKAALQKLNDQLKLCQEDVDMALSNAPLEEGAKSDLNGEC